MKSTICLVLLTLSLNISMQGQSISQIIGPDEVDPTSCNSYTYSVQTTNNDFTPSFSWSIDSPDAQLSQTGAATLNSATFTFKNGWGAMPIASNSNFIKVKVKVTFRKEGSDDVVVEAEKSNIKVKTLFNFNKMNITGDLLQSDIVTGSSIGLDCGIKTLNLEVNQPTTVDGQNVSYTWQSDWIPGGTTTIGSRTLTIQTDDNSSKTVKVIAFRDDRECHKQEYLITFSRTGAEVATPFITAANPADENKSICVNGTRTFTVNANNATSIQWTGSGVQFFTPNAQTTVVEGLSEGTATLTATVSNACGSKTVSKEVNVGAPKITPLVNWGPLSYPNYFQNPGFATLSGPEPGLSYSWQILNGTGNFYNSGTGQVYVYAYPFIRLQGSATNACGTTSYTYYLSNSQNNNYYPTFRTPMNQNAKISF